MFNFHCQRAFLYLKSITEASPTLKCNLLQRHPSAISLKFCTSTTRPNSNQHSFAVSYLIKKCRFSPETARKLAERVHFETSQKPDSVFTFFRNYGFTNAQIHSIVDRAPDLLLCDPNKRLLPKFEFLISKGASTSDVVLMATKSPNFLRVSLENHVIPAYELVRRFCDSDKKAIACVTACPTAVSDSRVALNVKLLLDDGVSRSNIRHLLRTRPSILCSAYLRKTVEELKNLGFDTSRFSFSVALLAKRAVAKSQWDAKVDALKSCGWSEEEISDAFRRYPGIMLRSKDKINAVMSFWTGQLGWNPSVLLRSPAIFGYSLEKKLIPRASVVQYIISKGLRKKDFSLITPFGMSEESFLQRYVKCFKEEEASQLLKLYQEKKNESSR